MMIAVQAIGTRDIPIQNARIASHKMVRFSIAQCNVCFKKIIILVMLAVFFILAYINLIEQKYLDLVIVLLIFFGFLETIERWRMLRLSDLHKAILTMILLPIAIYSLLRSSDLLRNIALCGVILLASSYFLHRFFKSRARMLK